MQNNFLKRSSELSAAKQALLEKRLKHITSSDAILPPSPSTTKGGKCPLSFAQQRLWFLQELDPESSVYNEPIAVRLNGPLDITALTYVAREITRRHEVLRSTFPVVDGEVIQIINPKFHEQLTLQVIDLQALAPEVREAEVYRITNEQMQRPFHLDTEVPWRTVLLRLGEEEHISLTVMHHIITDAWSMEIFVREIGILYTFFRNNQPSPLPELSIQYSNYVLLQRQWQEEGKFDKQLTYWKKQLAGTLPVLELPADYARPRIQTHQGSRYTTTLPAPLLQSLHTLSRQEGVTLFMTLLAAFEVVLHRYTQQTDILVGSPIAGRTRAELEGLLGCFVNTLVLRTDLSGNPSFQELLKRVRAVTLGAYDHQDVPFEKLVEELQPTRDLSHSPLFQVLFVLQNVPTATENLDGLTISSIPLENTSAKFDISLQLQETAHGLHAILEYNRDIFKADTIQRFLGHFQHILEELVTDPSQHIDDVVLLTQGEREQIQEWNNTTKAYDLSLCLHEIIEKQVNQTPEAIAVVFDNKQLTYLELNQRANQLAYHLQKFGAGPDKLIGICMERSLEMVVSLLAILKAGSAYVPIDPTYPRERFSFLLQDAQVSILLTQEHLQTQVSAQEAHIIYVDKEWATIASAPIDNLPNSAKPENLAYMIYTSGSTGKPKGAMNTHRAINNRLQWMQEAYQLDASDRVLQKTPFSFDVSVWEFFWPLMYGAQLVVAQPEGHRDSAYLIKLIQDKHISIVHFVPSMLRIFIEEQNVEACSSLKHVICSGEALSFDLQQRFFERLHAQLYNLYGPTEAAVDVTSWKCERESKLDIVPIGYPIANLHIHLLDEHLQQVPVGVVGNLHIGGVGLARGYHHRPTLTAEKFIPDNFDTINGSRLYKTGDLARYLSNGAIEYIGRSDHQIKLRGFRIELGEVEAALAAHPVVRENVVMVREDTIGDQRLVAYVVPAQEELPKSNDIRNFLKEHLPDFMIPSTLVLLTSLPLSPNGKLDRKALPAPNESVPMLEIAYVAPRTSTEKTLAEIWSKVICVEQVGLSDNFFEIGGHSLLITQIVARVRDTFGVDLPLRALFKNATLGALAEEIERVKARSAELYKPALAAASRQAYRMKRSSLTEDTHES